jgi:hypothetical protein
VQLLCNQNFNCLPCRWTPITTVNDGESYGSRVGRLGQTGHYKRVSRYYSDQGTDNFRFARHPLSTPICVDI